MAALKNKTVVITGASAGIGRLGARALGLSALLLGGACGALLSRWPWLMHLLAALLACWLADFYFFDRSALAGLTALVVFVGLSSRYEPNLRFQLTVFSLGFSLLMLPFAWRPYLQPALEAGPAAAAGAPAPLIHLIVDEYVAPEAQPPVGRMRGFEQTLRDDYLRRGFALYRSTRSVSGLPGGCRRLLLRRKHRHDHIISGEFPCRLPQRQAPRCILSDLVKRSAKRFRGRIPEFLDIEPEIFLRAWPGAPNPIGQRADNVGFLSEGGRSEPADCRSSRDNTQRPLRAVRLLAFTIREGPVVQDSSSVSMCKSSGSSPDR